VSTVKWRRRGARLDARRAVWIIVDGPNLLPVTAAEAAAVAEAAGKVGSGRTAPAAAVEGVLRWRYRRRLGRWSTQAR